MAFEAGPDPFNQRRSGFVASGQESHISDQRPGMTVGKNPANGDHPGAVHCGKDTSALPECSLCPGIIRLLSHRAKPGQQVRCLYEIHIPGIFQKLNVHYRTSLRCCLKGFRAKIR